jgi:hypothetical protein
MNQKGLNFFGVVLLLMYSSCAAFAQTLEWSNTQKLRGNSIFTTIIGEDESGIYVLRHRNKLLSKFVVLEKYRHNLGLEASKSFLLKNTRILYSDINESGILLIKQIFDKKLDIYRIVANVLNSNLETTQPELLITTTNLPHSLDELSFFIKPSPDHKHYLLLNYGLTNTKQNSNRFIIIDQKINKIDEGEFTFDLASNIEKIEDVVFDKHLKFTLLLSTKKNKNGISSIAIYDQNKTIRITDSNYRFEKPLLYYNPVKDLKGLSGYYTSDIENGFEGSFSVSWKNSITDSLKINRISFSHSVLKELVGETKSQTGFLPPTYLPVKLVCRSDGGFLMISENTFNQKEQDIMVVNGVASPQGKNVFTFENILVQNFDSLGKLSWENWVIKTQNTVNDGGMISSVFVSVTETAIYLFFNDPIASGGDIVYASFLTNGQRDTKVAARGDEMNAFIIPAEGKQISSDKIIVPVLKDRKFALLKITFKQ